MKNIQSFNRIIVIVAISIISIFISTKAEAQCSCPYNVTNNLTCSISVKFVSVHGTNPVVVCNTLFATIGAGQTQAFACGVGAGCTATPTDCAITILTVNGGAVNQTVNSGNSPITFINCAGTPGGASATWTSTVTTIN